MFLVSPDGQREALPLRRLRVPVQDPDVGRDRMLCLELPYDMDGRGFEEFSLEALITAVQDSVLAVDRR